ncbi:hypothetical protein H1R20_g5780, partial [Candolleomyces eurysporus]
MALNAADLQRRHELEGAPDPFPTLIDDAAPKPRQAKAKPQPVDTNSETAFPIKPSVAKAPVFVDSFTLSALDLSNVGKDGRASTLGEVMKLVMAKYKVKIEASANQKQTTFHIKAESQKELDKAKRSLLALLSPVITLVLNAPASTIGSIIGPKGATLKHIRDQTSVRVDIPKKDTLAPTGNGHANGDASGGVSPAVDDEEDEPTVPVTLVGPQPLAYEAQAMLKEIIASRTSSSTRRVRDIPAHILPFVVARRNAYLNAAQSTDINLSLNAPAREITATGDREAVGRVVDAIKATIEHFETNLNQIKMSLSKRQHRLLTGKASEEIMTKSKCTITVPPYEDASDELTVWGLAADLPNGLSAVMEQANSQYIHEFPLPGPLKVSKELVVYIQTIDYLSTLKAEKEDVEVYLPPLTASKGPLSIDLVGDKSNTDVIVKRLSELIGKLIGATRTVTIGWQLHKVVQGKNAEKLSGFHGTNKVSVYFPAEALESSDVLLVYDPFAPGASFVPGEKKKQLDIVEKELQKMAKAAADVKTELVTVEKRWHDTVLGALDTITGGDNTLSLKFGAEAGESSEDVILVRGLRTDVDRVAKDIVKLVEDSKADEIARSYSIEFEIDREYVGRIVGSQGAGVHKLRDQLDVRVDVSDESDDKEKEKDVVVGKKKKVVTHAKSKVKITGRKENADEAKKRILAQVERMADETSETLKIPAQFHASLIGEKGKYAIRLEDKYGVKINFPRHGSSDSYETKTREPLKADEVLVKGGRKGVAGAKSELLEALEFEKENNNTITFSVPTRCIPRIVGRGGATINEIKDNTDTFIDLDKDGGATSNITVRGTKKNIAEAKAAILAIADQVPEESTDSVIIENRYHRSIIGAGGQGLKDLIARCDGPSDSKVQAGLIRFPRQGETGDEVRLRGDPKLVAKLKAELEKIAAELRDRVIIGVDIPAEQHRALIGRGGQTLNELQGKHKVQIQFPGSRSYGQVGQPENGDALSESDPANIVKITGSRSNVEAAAEDLKSRIKPPMPEGITKDINVPLKYHQPITQQGNFFRTLRGHGVQVEQSVQPQKSSIPTRPESKGPAPSARIDDEEESPEESAYEWQVVENYQDPEEGDSVWTLKGRDEAALEKAEKLINDAIQNAEKMTHVGFLTLVDRSSFPRIVGTKGANVARLRAETGADITVSRENNTIVVIGSESEITNAKDAILKLVASPGRPRRQNNNSNNSNNNRNWGPSNNDNTNESNNDSSSWGATNDDNNNNNWGGNDNNDSNNNSWGTPSSDWN